MLGGLYWKQVQPLTGITMQLLGLWTLLLLTSTCYGADNITTVYSGLVANPMSTSVVIALPSACQYSLKSATLYVNGPTNATYSFTVPQCRLKRDLIVLNNNSQSGNLGTVNVGYQIQDLKPSSTYTAYYTVGSDTFTPVTFTTANGFSGMPPVTFARSGGMVVITVILSVAMLLLVVGLITVLVLGGRSTK
ncbi:uroplakin-2 isoform X2 [Pseudophryne corroboree]|uniref:uroplakin-2 isoform X2 n=1 Tax=Pseudophryne corroboree TaxID=495146 RepID=UPI0030821E09